jgi:hypothetical protein
MSSVVPQAIENAMGFKAPAARRFQFLLMFSAQHSAVSQTAETAQRPAL